MYFPPEAQEVPTDTLSWNKPWVYIVILWAAITIAAWAYVLAWYAYGMVNHPYAPLDEAEIQLEALVDDGIEMEELPGEELHSAELKAEGPSMTSDGSSGEVSIDLGRVATSEVHTEIKADASRCELTSESDGSVAADVAIDGGVADS
eukprot:gene570-970_t